MPVAEEIRELTKTSGPKVIDYNVREIWRTENPNRNPNDFYSQPEMKWKAETKGRLDDFSNRFTFESSTHQLLSKIDETTDLQFRPNDRTYTSLMGRFEDNEIGIFGNKWEIPNDAMADFKVLVKGTDEIVQRNAGNLQIAVKSVREVASEEVGAQARRDAEARKKNNPNIDPAAESANATKDWQTSKLNQSVENIEKALADWDKLLAEKALPEAGKLKAEANKLDASLHEFYREHVPSYLDDRTAPFVKHQLLATMRSVSEMVASQYAARLGTPSFSAAHRLILEVPLSGTYAASTDQKNIQKIAAKAPGKGAMWDLAKGLSNERDTFMSQLKKADRASYDKLSTRESSSLDKALESDLTRWRKAYDAVGSGDRSKVQELYQATADVAFRFKNYKATIEDTLKKSPASETAKKQYLATLDVFVSTLSSGLQVGRKLM